MPPSTSSTLNPIVIPEIQVPPHFTTLGTGLLHESHPRESIATLTTVLLSGASLFPNKAKPKPWWRAQCLLYGLDAPVSRPIQSLRETLENALRRGELRVPEELVEMEHAWNGRFRKLNAQVREATTAMTGVQKGKKTKGGKGEDALKRVSGAPKIAKKPSAAAKKRATGGITTSSAPTKKQAKKGTSWPGIPAARPPTRVKQTARSSRGDHFGQFSRPTNLDPAPVVPKPRTKQTARCSRGGRGGRGGTQSSRSIKSEPAPSAPKPRPKQMARRGGASGGGGRANRGAAPPRPAPRPDIKEEEFGGACEDYPEYGYESEYGYGGGNTSSHNWDSEQGELKEEETEDSNCSNSEQGELEEEEAEGSYYYWDSEQGELKEEEVEDSYYCQAY